MDIPTKVLSVISHIYDVTLEPDRWSETLDEICDSIGFIGSNLFIGDHITSELTELRVSTRLHPALAYYLENGYNRIEEAFLPVLWDILPERKLVKLHDAYQEFNQRYGGNIDTTDLDAWMKNNLGVQHIVTSPLNFSPAFRDFISFHLSEKCDRRISEATILLPHLAKAVELSRPFRLLKSRFKSVINVLDRFHLGVFILTKCGHILLRNRAAERISDANDGFVMRSNRLHCLNPDSRKYMHAAICHVLGHDSPSPTPKSRQIPIPRNNGKMPYLLDISAIHHSELDDSGFFEGILIIAIDPEHKKIINTTGLNIIFRLTPAEKHICELLVQGLTTDEIADSRNTKLETVRGQIKQLLTKTQSRKRSDLIKLALTINLPVDEK